MATFFLAFLQTAGLLALFSIPLFVLSQRKGRRQLAPRYLIAIGVIGLVAAVVAFSSEQLIARCIRAGSIECLDYGSTGLNVAIGLGYIIVAWINTIILIRE